MDAEMDKRISNYPLCIDCQFFEIENEGQEWIYQKAICNRKMIVVDRDMVTGSGNCFFNDCEDERKNWFFGCTYRGKHFKKKVSMPIPPKITKNWFEVNYPPDDNKQTEIADLLIRRSGFNETDAKEMAKEIIAIWVQPANTHTNIRIKDYPDGLFPDDNTPDDNTPF